MENKLGFIKIIVKLPVVSTCATYMFEYFVIEYQ